MRRIALLALLFLIGAPPLARAQSELWPLRLRLAGCERVEVTVGSEEAVEKLAPRIEEHSASGDLEYTVRFEGDERDPDAARVLLGTAEQDEPARLATLAGVELIEGGGFRLLDYEFTDPRDLLLAVLEDPEREGWPVTLWLGNDSEQMLRQVRDLRPRWRPRVQVWSAGTIAVDLPLSISGHLLLSEGVDYRARRREAAEKMLFTLPLGALTFRTVSVPRLPRMKKLVASAGVAYAKTAQWLGTGRKPHIPVFVHTHPEDLARLFACEELGAINPVDGGAHVLLADGIVDAGPQVVARATALALAGEPVEEWMLDGVAIAATGNWWGRDLVSWVGFLASHDLVPSIADLRDPHATSRISPHIVMPLRGMLVQALLGHRGPRGFLPLWSGNVPLRVDASLELIWRRALGAARARHDQQVAAKSEARYRGILASPFRAGVALVDAGRDRSSDYLDRSVEGSLARARELGADAFSVTVFASALNPAPVAPAPLAHPFHGSCSDLALAHAVGAGRRLGLRATLVLESLASLSGVRADATMLIGEADWDDFFDSFERMVEHYGLLAELLGCEVFCLGVELGKAEKSFVEETEEESLEGGGIEGDAGSRGHRLRRWRELIATAREVFSGALTYTAKSEENARDVGFWEELDFIGLTLFPAMRKLDGDSPDNAIRAHYQRGLQRAVELARLHRRPVLILQAGFPSTSSPWRRSWVPAGESDLDGQRRVLGLLGEALDEYRDHRGVRGIYLWNWHADPSALSPAQRGFSPQGKPAEEILPRLFGVETQ
jgi:hypothetical protein